MHTPPMHRSLSLSTTVPLHAEGADMMDTVMDSGIRWADVHRQARRIAARNAQLKRREAECEMAERRALELAEDARSAQVRAAVMAVAAAALALLAVL